MEPQYQLQTFGLVPSRGHEPLRTPFTLAQVNVWFEDLMARGADNFPQEDHRPHGKLKRRDVR